MRLQPAAIGYVRADVSRIQQRWDEERIRRLAKRLGYNLIKTVVADGRTNARPLDGLISTVHRTGAEAVVVPSEAHFDDAIPAEVVRIADVITVFPEATYAREATGALPDLNGVQR